MAKRQLAAIIGGGVIGGGWAARFLLNGWDVNVYDPSLDARESLQTVLQNARQSLPLLYDEPMPLRGKLTFCDTLEQAVSHASWIQESVPERLEVKQTVYNQVLAACQSQAIIGSSTSGFRPTQLCEQAKAPHSIVVAHPYNPVYLLPIVELVSSQSVGEGVIERAQAILSGIGMKPLHIKKEIDAHIGDRLLEAVWREALWMIKDGIATTKEIDDVMINGFGLRWAQMGLFETYRVAGGKAGMKHFISQFGPALQWPWSRLTDVPEFTPELVDMIASQSDQQSGHHSITELEQIRDKNLVGFMKVLKENDWGAGKVLNEHGQKSKE